jgi:putative transposase
MEIGELMRAVAGEFARAYNQRKGRKDAYWGDNYHATMVDSGEYLWRCLLYIELNMVRCGVVGHPREWKWLGYHEIMGVRRRYRLLDLDRLCWRLRASCLEGLRAHLQVSLREALAKEQMKRDPRWTESVAIGSRRFVEKIEPTVLSRRKTEIVETRSNIWTLKESQAAYSVKSSPKNSSKAALR